MIGKCCVHMESDGQCPHSSVGVSPDGRPLCREHLESVNGSGKTRQGIKATERALDRQVGGDHYRSMVIQPMEFCMANRIEKAEGDVIAYVARWRAKNGVEDLRKARHTLDLLIEHAENGEA